MQLGFKKLYVLLFIFSIAGNVFSATDPLDVLHELLSQIPNYEYGESRENLVKISNLVRENLSAPHIISDFEKEFITFLESDAGLPSKQFICEELSLFATEQSLPVLTKLLDVNQTFEMALFTLERFPGEEVNDLIRKKLPKVDNPQKVALINALGNRRDKNSAKQIIKYIDAKDQNVSAAAIHAAGKMGGISISENLKQRLQKKDPEQKNLLLDAWLDVAGQFGKERMQKEAIKIFETVFNSNNPTQFRHAALQGILEFSDRNPAELLIEIIKKDKPEDQNMAIQLFHKIPSDADLHAIVAAFPGFSAKQQVQILAALAGRTDSVVAGLLEDALKNKNESVRITALKSLVTSGSSRSVLPVAERAAYAEGEEQKAARECLYTMNAAGVDETIMNGIDTSADEVKIELIKSCAERSLTRAEDTIHMQLPSANSLVRLEAVKALGKIGSANIVPVLVEHLKYSQNSRETQETGRSIIALCKKYPADEVSSKLVLNELDALVENGKLESAYTVLGNVGDPAALPILRNGLKSGDDAIITAAIKALSDWPDGRPLNDLKDVAKSAKNETHRVLALRGFVRLLSMDTEIADANKSSLYQFAMDISKSQGEREMVLSGIANINSPNALKFATQYLNDPELKPASQLAAVQIAENIGIAGIRTSLPVLRKIVNETEDSLVQQRCKKLINKLEKFEDFIVTWEVAGPYEAKDANLFDFAFEPEQDNPKAVKWELLPVGLDADKYWYLSLETYFGGDNRIAYIRNRIYSDRDQEVMLEIGSDDGNKVWINGALINSVDAARECTPGDDKVQCSLKKGWNQVLMKVVNGSGGWGACLRYRNIDGSKVTGIKAEI